LKKDISIWTYLIDDKYNIALQKIVENYTQIKKY